MPGDYPVSSGNTVGVQGLDALIRLQQTSLALNRFRAEPLILYTPVNSQFDLPTAMNVAQTLEDPEDPA